MGGIDGIYIHVSIVQLFDKFDPKFDIVHDPLPVINSAPLVLIAGGGYYYGNANNTVDM